MKRIYWGVCLILLLAGSCKNKNPNLSETELVSAMEQPSGVGVMDTSSMIPEEYTRSIGIRYKSRLDSREPLVRLDIEVALKNVRPVRLSDFGSEVVYHRLGKFEHGLDAAFCPVENGCLVTGLDGLWLLDKNLKKDRLLIKNDVEIMSYQGNQGFRPKSMIRSYDYDPSSRMVYCQFTLVDKEKGSVMYVSRISLAELQKRSSPLELKDMQKHIRTGEGYNAVFGSARIFSVKDGFGLYRETVNGLYTFAANGDTLCHFIPGNNVFEEIKGTTIRNGESSNIYRYKGQCSFRLAYTDTLFRTLDASTFCPVYKIDFGKHQTTRSEGMGTADLSDKYLVHNLTETNRHLFLSLNQNHDSPNARKAGNVKFFQVIYDKESGELYSFTSKKEKVLPGLIPNDLDGGIDFWPKIQIEGRPYMMIMGKFLKRDVPTEHLSKIPALQGLDDNEMVLITVR